DLDDDHRIGVGGDVSDGLLVVKGDEPYAGQIHLLVRVGDYLNDLGGEPERGSDCSLAGGVAESWVVPPLPGAVGEVAARVDDGHFGGGHFCPPFVAAVSFCW